MRNELLPFDLQTALKHPECVVYRNGEKPLEWHWMEKANQKDYCITSVLSDGSFETHLRNGRTLLGQDTGSSDLFLLPLPEKTYWVNVYKDSKLNDLLCCSQVVFDSEHSAKYGVDLTRPFIKTITFTV